MAVLPVVVPVCKYMLCTLQLSLIPVGSPVMVGRAAAAAAPPPPSTENSVE